MGYQDTEALMVQAVKDYYNNDMSLFYQILHPKAIIMSVGEGQLVQGKDHIIKVFHGDVATDIHYELSDICCMTQRIGVYSCVTLMDCKIITMYPDKVVEIVNQRISIVWKYIHGKAVEREQVPTQGWYALNIHISLAHNIKQKTENYAHVSQALLSERLMAERLMTERVLAEEEKIVLRDSNACVHYVDKSQVVRLETRDRHVVAVLSNGSEIIMKKKISQLEKEFGDDYIRISRKYLVNSKYVERVKNYQLYTIDGAALRIPEEKYREIKQKIERKIGKNQKNAVFEHQKPVLGFLFIMPIERTSIDCYNNFIYYGLTYDGQWDAVMC